MTKKILLIIFSIIILVAIAGLATFVGINWDKLQGAVIDNVQLYTIEDLNAAAERGYTEAKTNEDILKNQIENLKEIALILESDISNLNDQLNIKQSDILDLTAQLSNLNGQIDLLNTIIIARDLTIEGLQEDIESLQAQVLGLKQQLFNIFEEQYNRGFEDGVSSVDVNEYYQNAYDVGYNAGYAKQERIYEEIEANVNVVWNGTIDTLWYTADNQLIDSTYDSITGWYIIYKPSQLAGLAQLVNSGISFEGQTVALLNNMILNNSEIDLLNFDDLTSGQISSLNSWNPIGTVENPFKGTLYGFNHNIVGLYINSVENDCVGLFGSINNAILYDLCLNNLYINAHKNVGSFCGNSNSSIFENLRLENVYINSFSHSGGFVGVSNNSEFLSVFGTVEIEGEGSVGGLIGYSYNDYIDNSSINAKIFINRSDDIGFSSFGGVIGTSFSSNIENVNVSLFCEIISIPRYDHDPIGSLEESLNKFSISGIIGNLESHDYGGLIKNVNVYFDVPSLASYSVASCYHVFWVTMENALPILENVRYNISGYSNFLKTINGLNIVFDESIESYFSIHNYIEIERVNVSCEEDGYITYECSRCGKTYTEVFPALGHNWVVVEVIQPTENEPGYTIYECSHCGEIKYDNYIYGTLGLIYTGLDLNGDITTVEEDIVSYMIGDGSNVYGNGYVGVDVDVVILQNYLGLPVTKIGNYAFYGRIINSIKIPNSIKVIDSLAFYNCYNLISMTIPDSVIAIGNGAFGNCNKLVQITNLSGEDLSGLPDNLGQEIRISLDTPFVNTLSERDENGVHTFTVGDTVYLISFDGRTTDLDLSDYTNITVFYDYVFMNFLDLTSIIIPNSVTSLRKYAFTNCYNLISITIPDSITNIGPLCFSGCGKLVQITNLSNMNLKNSGPLPNNPGQEIRTSLDTPFVNILSERDENGFQTFTVGDTVYLISFDGRTTDLDLSDYTNINVIYQFLFYGNKTLTSIILPDSIIEIQKNVFQNCSSLISITIPNSVTTISLNAVYESLVYGCSSNLEIYCEVESKPVGWSDYWNCITSSVAVITYWGFIPLE